MASDRRHLAAKLAEADFAITQFFFEPEPYLRLVDDLAALDCDKPVIPGIMPVTNAGQVARFAQLAGAEFPAHLASAVRGAGRRPRRGAASWAWSWPPSCAGPCSSGGRRACTSTP